MTVGEVCRAVLRDPAEMVFRRWNWKASLLSSLMRAALFFFTNLSAGWRAATGAMLIQFVFRAVVSGYYAALTQAFRKAEPAWAAALVATFALPALAHLAEGVLHWVVGTPQLQRSIIASVIFTMVSSLFNWYAMRQGALVVGDGGDSLAKDFRRMPRIVAGFVAAPFLALLGCARGRV